MQPPGTKTREQCNKKWVTGTCCRQNFRGDNPHTCPLAKLLILRSESCYLLELSGNSIFDASCLTPTEICREERKTPMQSAKETGEIGERIGLHCISFHAEKGLFFHNWNKANTPLSFPWRKIQTECVCWDQEKIRQRSNTKERLKEFLTLTSQSSDINLRQFDSPQQFPKYHICPLLSVVRKTAQLPGRLQKVLFAHIFLTLYYFCFVRSSWEMKILSSHASRCCVCFWSRLAIARKSGLDSVSCILSIHLSVFMDRQPLTHDHSNW